MDETFDQYVTEIKKVLHGYGQDIAMSDAKPWEQRFGTPDIALALIPIVGWFLKTILEVIIEHEVKKRIDREPIEKRISDLEASLQNLEKLVEQTINHEISTSSANKNLQSYYVEVIQQYESLGRSDFMLIKMHEEELLEVLQSIGFTPRRALKLSAKIFEISEKFLIE